MSRQAGKRRDTQVRYSGPQERRDGTGKVVVAYLHPGRVEGSFHTSLLNLWMWDLHHDQRILDGGGHISMESGANIVNGRNDATRAFLDEHNAEWLLWIDSDMGFDPDVADRLIAAADPKERPIVGGLCFGRWLAPGAADIFPTLYWWDPDGNGVARATDYPENELIQVGGTGAAMLLIHRSVLEAMRAKWPPPWEWFQESLLHGQAVGEDMTFCLRAISLDFPIYVHTGIRTTHRKYIDIDEGEFRRYQARKRPPPVVITGTGRSGTGYLSQLLRFCGVNCGHEEWFNPFGKQTVDLHADASWLALPAVAGKDYPGKVFLQVRDPLKVLSSLWNGEILEGWALPYLKVKVDNTPGWEPDGDWRENSVRFMVHWLKTGLEECDGWWRVEDLDAEQIIKIAAECGVTVDPERVALGLEAISPRTNKHTAGPKVAWGDLPDIPESRELRDLAAVFGYVKEGADAVGV